MAEHPLWIEALTDEELSERQWQYTRESIDKGFFPGKLYSEHFLTTCALTRELEIRRDAI